MSDKERQKKDGQDKNKKNQARRRDGQLKDNDSASTVAGNVNRPATFDEDDPPGEPGSTSASRTARAKAAREVKGK
jgi:hypothetical protein